MGNLMNYMYMLSSTGIASVPDTPEGICNTLAPLLRLVGIILLIIKIAVPIILIVIGMLELAKAVGDQDEVSKATKKLVQKLIIAVLVFLVSTVVGLVMTLIGSEDYKKCATCLNTPYAESCKKNFNQIIDTNI